MADIFCFSFPMFLLVYVLTLKEAGTQNRLSATKLSKPSSAKGETE